MEGLLRSTKYYDGYLWYKLSSKDKHKMINNGGNLKDFIVIDVTDDKIFTKSEFLVEKSLTEASADAVVEALETIKYKVYRKIKLK